MWIGKIDLKLSANPGAHEGYPIKKFKDLRIALDAIKLYIPHLTLKLKGIKDPQVSKR